MSNRVLTPCIALLVFASAAAVVVATTKNNYPDGAVVATATLEAAMGVNATKGRGKATVVMLENGTTTVTVNLTGCLYDLTMAHIHVYNASAGNPILLGLLPIVMPGGPSKLNPPITYKGSFSFVSVGTLDPIVFNGLLFHHLLYVNVHTVKYPGGEISGTLICKYGCKLPM